MWSFLESRLPCYQTCAQARCLDVHIMGRSLTLQLCCMSRQAIYLPLSSSGMTDLFAWITTGPASSNSSKRAKLSSSWPPMPGLSPSPCIFNTSLCRPSVRTQPQPQPMPQPQPLAKPSSAMMGPAYAGQFLGLSPSSYDFTAPQLFQMG